MVRSVIGTDERPFFPEKNILGAEMERSPCPGQVYQNLKSVCIYVPRGFIQEILGVQRVGKQLTSSCPWIYIREQITPCTHFGHTHPRSEVK